MDIPRFKTYVDEVPDHICDLNIRLVVQMALYGTEHPSSSERVWGALRKSFLVSRRHPFTKRMFRSTSTIAAEIVRHMETAPYIIHPYSLFRHYILTYFFIDVISSIPYTYIFACKLKLFSDKAYYWLDAICALKVLRLRTIYRLYAHMGFRLGLNLVGRQIGRIVLAIVFYLHWVACFCCAVTAFSKDPEGFRNTNVSVSAMWINHFDADNTEYTWRNAMLRAITLTFACGFRLIFTHFGDMLANIIFFLTGIVVVVLVAVRVVVIGRTVESTGTQYEMLETELMVYMRHKRVRRPLKDRLLEYYSFSFEHTYYQEPVIMDFLSGQLQRDLLLQKGRMMMQSTDVFDDIAPSTMVRLMAGLRTAVVLPGDVVLRMGKPADRMVYVFSGTLAVYDVAGKELCHLTDGQVMGEESLVATGEVLGVTVIALEASELWVLPRTYFNAAMRPGADRFMGGYHSLFPRQTLERLKRRLNQSIPSIGRESLTIQDLGTLR